MKYLILYNIAFIVFWALFSLVLYFHGTQDNATFLSNWMFMNMIVGAGFVVEVILVIGSRIIEKSEKY